MLDHLLIKLSLSFFLQNWINTFFFTKLFELFLKLFLDRYFKWPNFLINFITQFFHRCLVKTFMFFKNDWCKFFYFIFINLWIVLVLKLCLYHVIYLCWKHQILFTLIKSAIFSYSIKFVSEFPEFCCKLKPWVYRILCWFFYILILKEVNYSSS